MVLMAMAAVAAAATVSAAPTPPVDLNRQVSGATYYNRPGADLSAHDADLRACIAEAAKTEQGVGAGIAAPMIMTAFNITSPGIVPNIENCMVTKKWRVVRVEAAEGARLTKLAQPELSLVLKDWVGSETVHGEVARVWANDAALARTVKYSFSTPVINRSLSFAALAPVAPPPPSPTAAPWPDRPSSARPVDALKTGAFGAAPPGDAIIIVGVTGTGGSRGWGIAFQRMGRLPDTPAWIADQRPDFFLAAWQGIFAKKGSGLFAYAVPAGRWRLAGLLGVGAFIDFCLGAPSFEARAGDVIYAGTFDFSAPELRPDLDVAPALALLSSQPAMAAKLHAAAYSNGSTTSCVRPIAASWSDSPNFYIYNYEIDAPTPPRDETPVFVR
ncbi:MAG: hypothetical protein JWP35_2805 [Caulobacter sp.]|nr:hypothetical protein [Caulobacter sp.]